MSDLFEEAPFFMVRTPLLSIEVYFRLLESTNLEEDLLKLFRENHRLQEAIFIASPDLFHELSEIETSRNKEALVSSLFRYVSRMTTRATPFGLFSAVGFGNWGDQVNNLDLDSLVKRVRPDAEWLVKYLDKNSRPQKNCKYKRNPLLKGGQGRIELDYSRKNEGVVSVRASPLVMNILQSTKRAISCEEIVKNIEKEFPGIDLDKTLGVVHSLVEQDILLSTALPSLLNADLLGRVESSIPDNVLSGIKSYNTNSQNSLETLESLEWEMRRIQDSHRSLQVDTAFEKEVTLPATFLNPLKEALELLWTISPGRLGISELRGYHEKFLEKYGTFRLVPLQELIDATTGLGFPEHYQSSPQRRRDENLKLEKDFEVRLGEEIFKAIRDGSKEIELSQDWVSHPVGRKPQDAPNSFDLFCEIHASSTESLEKGACEIFVFPVTGAGDVGSTFGRFIHLFDPSKKEKLIQLFKKEEVDSVRTAEISYFPKAPRNANVATHPLLRTYSIDVGNVEEDERGISLEELYVGATGEGLYIALRDGTRVAATAMNALNVQAGPPIVRLLREISKEGIALLYPFSFGAFENLPFLPRVRYKNVILSPAQWLVKFSQIRGDKNDSLDSLCNKFTAWAHHHQLPRFLLMTEGDNRILLDRTHPFHVQEILQKLKKQPVLLVEWNSEKAWMPSQEGKHSCEFVIPFLKSEKYKKKDLSPCIGYVPIPPSLRWKSPGSEWLYANLYLERDREERFIWGTLTPWIASIRGHFEKWFYIRYVTQEGGHIRLRLKTDHPGQMLELFHQFADPLLQAGWLKNVTLASYEREIERYGGAEQIDLMESFFQVDSEVGSKVIEWSAKNRSGFPDYILALFSLVDLMKGFGKTLPEMVDLLEGMGLDKKELKGYREWKSRLNQALGEFFLQAPKHLAFYELFAPRRILQQQHIWKMNDSVLKSLMHMNCNRILGTDNLIERKSYLFALQTLIGLQHQGQKELSNSIFKK